MYIGKHRGTSRDPQIEERAPVHIPENYGGNAFREQPIEAEEEPLGNVCTDEANEETASCYLPSPIKEKQKERGILPNLDKLFSSDTLLILLAILLAGSEDGGEVSLLLLLLLLF